MEEESKWEKRILKGLSYLLVATITCALTLTIFVPGRQSGSVDSNASGGEEKLTELADIIEQMYIGDADREVLIEAAADAMVTATGDRWSYYIPAAEMESYTEQKENAYVGIGVTIQVREDNKGYDVVKVEPGSPAREGGVLPGDVIVGVENTRVTDVPLEDVRNMIRGEVGTTVNVVVSRDGEELTLPLLRARIQTVVAAGQMLTDTIGYIRITNFDDRAASETKACLEKLEKEGAQAFVFDVRFNPGGYKHELVDLLDYLLPEGILFRSESYTGFTSEDKSDAFCKDVPMAVLINGDSYSAAEFFAAALKEYDYAFTVGQPTTGKGYFQNTIPLSDGSAVALSVGKYFTPKGVSLAEVGGLVPDILVEVDEETAALIYSELLDVQEDPQIQAAVKALQK